MAARMISRSDIDGYASSTAWGGCRTATGRARRRNGRPTQVPRGHGKRVPKPQGIKPPWLSKHGDAGPAPCSRSFSEDIAGGGRSPKEGLGMLLVCSPSPAPCQADLASPLHPTKPNSKLLEVDLARIAHAKLTAWHSKGNWTLLRTSTR